MSLGLRFSVPASVSQIWKLVRVPLGYGVLITAFFWPALSDSILLAPGDAFIYYVPAYYGPKSSWSNLLFSGFPLGADSQSVHWYPPARLLSVMPNSWNVYVLLAYFIAANCTYLFIRSLHTSRLAAFIGGIVYGFSGFMVAHLGHTAIIHSAAWLPLILFSIEKLKSEQRSRWFVLASVSVALSLLAGHPQITLYSLSVVATYALVNAAGRPRSLRYLVMCGSACVLGLILAAAQLLPSYELAGLTARNAVSLALFNSFSLPPSHLFTLIFPYFFGHRGTQFYGDGYFGAENPFELAGYVGLVTLFLAFFPIRLRGTDRRLWYWLALAIVSVLLALGSFTPVSALLFEIPPYNRFRVPARHLIELTMAVSVLSAYTLSNWLAQPRQTPTVWRPILLFLAIIAGAAMIPVLFSDRLQVLASGSGVQSWSSLPWKNMAIAVPMLIAIAEACVLLICLKWPMIGKALLVFVIVLDFASFGWFCDWRFVSRKSLPPAPAVLESVRNEIQLNHQRVAFNLFSANARESAEPNLNLLWDLPSVNGYGPLIPERYSELLGMDGTGQIVKDVLRVENRGLDILATKYFLAPTHMTQKPLNDLAENQPLDLFLEGNCDKNKAEPVDLGSTSELVNRVVVVSSLANSAAVLQGTPVLEVSFGDESGNVVTLTLEAGVHTSEWAWEREDVSPIIAHQQASTFSDFDAQDQKGKGFKGYRYIASFDLTGHKKIRDLRLKAAAPCGANILVNRVILTNTATDKRHEAYPLRNEFDDQRWRMVASTKEGVLYENLHALPRVWLAEGVRKMEPAQVLNTIRTGRLPDGTDFNPASIALVESDIDVPLSQKREGDYAQVVLLNDTTVEVEAYSQQEGFLILSDIFYPGWQASVDDEPVEIHKTDYVLRGIVLPAGSHRVRFEFQSTAFRGGTAISCAALVLLMAIPLVALLRRRAR